MNITGGSEGSTGIAGLHCSNDVGHGDDGEDEGDQQEDVEQGGGAGGLKE